MSNELPPNSTNSDIDDDQWRSCKTDPPPPNVVVLTKIHDENGLRNVTKLHHRNRLWWFPDGSIYVYYVPTHWRPL